MKHLTIIAMLLIAGNAIFAQPFTNDTYRYDGSSQVPSSFLVNTNSAVGIGTTTPGYVLEVAGDMLNSRSSFFVENTNDFGQLKSLFGLPNGIPGAGAHYSGSGYRILNGVVNASLFGDNSYGAGGGLFNGNTGNVVTYFMGLDIAGDDIMIINFLEDNDDVKRMQMDGADLQILQRHTASGNTYSKEILFNDADFTLSNVGVDGSATTLFSNSIDLTDDDLTFLVSTPSGGSVDMELTLTNGVAITGKDNSSSSVGFQVLDNSSNDLMVIMNDGKVGINNSSPSDLLDVNGTVNIGALHYTGMAHNDYQLAVDGKIVAKEVVVTTTGWPDYVFAADYKLRSLEEVETFINDNGHLPDMPSAEEVTTNGVDVAKTNELLLMKIEELTLYMLQQQKEIEVLKAQIGK